MESTFCSINNSSVTLIYIHNLIQLLIQCHETMTILSDTLGSITLVTYQPNMVLNQYTYQLIVFHILHVSVRHITLLITGKPHITNDLFKSLPTRHTLQVLQDTPISYGDDNKLFTTLEPMSGSW